MEVAEKMTPQHCKYCGVQLSVDNLVYFDNEYWCQLHWRKKNRRAALAPDGQETEPEPERKRGE